MCNTSIVILQEIKSSYKLLTLHIQCIIINANRNAPRQVILNQLDKKDDWLGCILKADEIEVFAKSYVIEDIISIDTVNKICRKFCGYAE